MQKVGSTTDTADANGEWTNGNVAQGVSPTIINAAILNTHQRELVNIVESAGIPLDPNDDGQVLKAINKSVGGGRLLNTLSFRTSGTYTPTPGTKKIRITMTGGGGGGGGCQALSSSETFSGAGGGAGGTIITTFLLNGAVSYPVIIGAGGAGGNGPANGSDGGATTFGALV
ncbi:glycine-rich domain-containing protein, partial [Serratia fonticola]|uniref:glycine-rich domain-containing protein n=1 Tax=Serratia fonticola TaxID=47917 RepID=UPI003AAEC8F1